MKIVKVLQKKLNEMSETVSEWQRMKEKPSRGFLMELDNMNRTIYCLYELDVIGYDDAINLAQKCEKISKKLNKTFDR